MLKSSVGCVCGSLIGLLASSGSFASTGFASDPVALAVRHQNCNKAIAELNAIAAQPNTTDAFSLFVGGRMLDEGICTRQDANEATRYFERSAQLGDSQAQFDLATKIGMGQGTAQDYAVAGRTCHEAGVDPSGLLSFYSVGYACTVTGVAGRLLRTSLPTGAFRLPTRPAVVEFNLNGSQVRVVSAPEPQRGPAPLGSIIGPFLVDPQTAIAKAFREALEAVPKPDANSLSPGIVTLSLDLDISLEGGKPPPPSGSHDKILPGDVIEPNPFG
jgi:hypothetical protein